MTSDETKVVNGEIALTGRGYPAKGKIDIKQQKKRVSKVYTSVRGRSIAKGQLEGIINSNEEKEQKEIREKQKEGGSGETQGWL